MSEKFNIEIEVEEFERGGRPGYNPLAKIKVIIMSYCNDIYSSRKVEERCNTYNLTDDDTRKMKTADGAYINGYLAQVAVEGENHFIVATEVFSESNDSNCGSAFIKSIPVIEEQINKKNKTEVELNNIENESKSQREEIDNNKDSEKKTSLKILTDGGYGEIDLLVELEQNNIDAYIPISKTISGSENGENKEEIKDKINAAHCELKEKNGEIILECPGKRCYGTIKNRKTFKITKSICEHYQTIQRMRDKLESEQGKKIYAKRKTIIEHVNGEIKELHHFRAFSYRGRKKVNVQWGLVCLAYNIRKWHKLEKAA